ncbi:MFS transporter [Streptomyces naganishii]|uniref:Actinorhodin transporter n=1 Tax=Streptomyces naganishii JCM 4654 TaxID=1306179 RepID=A0A919CVT9_9ACTN|nr:MFS transporter [Streptomyces naganishii]GHD90602.1 putative actinorhodin transporter [Streptomyces naganishii JCM 4654]
MTHAEDETYVEGEGVPDPQRWRAAAVILVAIALDLIDTTIVNVALPVLQTDLEASKAALQWVAAAYTLTFALSLITVGRVGDMVGRKRMISIGILVFVAASLLCGVAQSTEMLIASRVLQGFGGAIVMTQGLSVFQVSFPPKERAAVFGMFGALSGVAAMLGPVLGGVLVDADLFGWSWRPIFLVNVPVGLFALLGVQAFVRESRAPHIKRLDLVGVALVTLALLSLLYPLVQGQEAGWPAWTFTAMACSVPLFVVFALYERKKAARDGSALVEPSLFRERSFVAGLLVMLSFFAIIAGLFFPFTLYLQVGLGFTPLAAGLTTVPFSFGAMITSSFSAVLAIKMGRKVLSIGMVIMGVGMVALIWTIGHFGSGISGWDMAPALAVLGLGLGFVISPVVDIVLGGVPVEHAGSGSGVLSTADQLGAAAGVAVIGVLFFNLLTAQAVPGADATLPHLRKELSAAGVSAASQDRIVTGFRACARQSAQHEDAKAPPEVCRHIVPAGAVPTGREEQVTKAIADASVKARKEGYAKATGHVLWYEVGIIALGFLLTFMLPRRARKPEWEDDGEQGGELPGGPAGEGGENGTPSSEAQPAGQP